MSAPHDLVNHLRLFATMGVDGVSRDRAWRERADVDRQPSVDSVTSFDPGQLEQQARASVPDEDDDETDTGADADATEGPHDAATSLAALREHIGECTRCPLHAQGRRQIVFGSGNPNAALMFVGEAPGADEDVQGEPFVGRAGQLLTKIIEAIGLSRSDVYIANVLKCRPPGNRNPAPEEVATCEPFLARQIDTIRPKVVVALGTFAAHALLKTDTPISRLRGQVHEFRNGAKLIPTFHPAFLLRSPDRKRDVWDDMKKVRAILADVPDA